MARSGFVWKVDTLTPGLKDFPGKLDRDIVAAIEYHAPVTEKDARENAPWHDQTSNARTGLHTSTAHVPFKSHTLTLAHRVPYGIWLEVRWSGKYAIIMPTIEKQGRSVMQMIKKLFRSGS